MNANGKGKEMLDSIFDRLINITSAAERSAEMRRYLAAMAMFHQYSWRNTLLIAAQRPDARRVAGFRTWLKLGRHVRRGEKGIVISAPIVVEEEVEGEDGEIVTRPKLVGFRDRYVFDISQTDGEDLPEPPAWWANRPADERVLALKERVIRAMREDGILVAHLPSIGGARGVSLGGAVGLLEGDATVGSLSTAVHEWAHELQRPKGGPASRAEKEVEAEAVAFVVLAAYGVDVPENGNYIASWAGEDAAEELRRFFEGVLEKARYIIARIEGRPAAALATAEASE